MSALPHDRWSLRAATERDLPYMARVHRAAYGPGHFLALLPEEALVEYYRPFLGGGSRAIVAEPTDADDASSPVAGFAVFGANIGPRIDVFKRQQRKAIFLTALHNPLAAAHKMALGVLSSAEIPPHTPADWLLLSIAVAKAHRGAGSALLCGMLRDAEAAGQPRLGLYVRHSNFRAVNAYLRVGFRIIASIADQYYMEIALTQTSLEGVH